MRAVEISLVFANLLIFCNSFQQLSSMASSHQLHFSHQMSKSEEDTSYLVEKMEKKIERLTIENAELKRAASSSIAIKYPALPKWFIELKANPDCCLVDDYVREWNDEPWRTSAGGFSGTDYVHSRSRAPARVLEYLIVKRAILGVDNSKDMNEGVFYPSLVGPAYFSSAAESHKGLCHGGSMCALMDDAIGWMGFCISGKPREWTGYTVQVSKCCISLHLLQFLLILSSVI
jgi:hypothetical protein